MKIDVWSSEGKTSVPLEDFTSVSIAGSDFYVECSSGIKGAISLDSINLILENKPEIVDEKALMLRKTREGLRLLFGNK